MVDRIIDQMGGTSTAVATELGMSVSAFLRGTKRAELSVHSILRLAEIGGVDPSTLLRAAGKGDTADLIERLYGAPVTPLSQADRLLIALEPDVKRQLVRLVKGLTAS